MARACLKIFIDDKCVRTFGGNKGSVIQKIAKIKEATRTELREEYSSLKEDSSFRYSIIRVKRRNKVYRLSELQDDLTEQEFTEILPNLDVLESLIKNVKMFDTKLNKEIVFNENGNIDCGREYDLTDLLTGYVKAEVVKKFGKKKVLEELLLKYNEVLSIKR